MHPMTLGGAQAPSTARHRPGRMATRGTRLTILSGLIVGLLVALALPAHGSEPDGIPDTWQTFERYVEPEVWDAMLMSLVEVSSIEAEFVEVVAGVEQWRHLVEVYAWDPDRMLRIMRCESRGLPDAVSPTDDWGLFQIHAPIWAGHFGLTRSDLLDPVTNVHAAWRVYTEQGYGAWVCDRYVR